MNQRGLGAARNDVPQAGGRYDIGDNVEGDDARTLCTGDEQISSNCEHVAARMTQCTATPTDQRALIHIVEEIVRVLTNSRVPSEVNEELGFERQNLPRKPALEFVVSQNLSLPLPGRLVNEQKP